MNRIAMLLLLPLGLIALFAVGCTDDGGTTDPDDATEFDGYESWEQVEYTNAPSDFLGAAHAGNDGEYTRRIHANAQALSRGARADYPEDAALVKETFTFDASGDKQWAAEGALLAMVKRAAGYDADGGDWEYFMLDPVSGDVVDSGADLMNGMCKGCHTSATGAAGEDFVFTHPYEFAVADGDFDDYASWHEIDSEQGPDAALGAAHAGNDENAVRTIFRKQLAANPAEGDWGYPVGTMIAKEVRDGAGAIIGMTGMVKRGAGFDASNGDWEWFVLDTTDFSMEARGTGAEVMGGMCVGCHGAANSGGNGSDYVFAHDGDPFNH